VSRAHESEASSESRRLWAAVLLLVVFGGGFWWVTFRKPAAPEPSDAPLSPSPATAEPMPEPAPSSPVVDDGGGAASGALPVADQRDAPDSPAMSSSAPQAEIYRVGGEVTPPVVQSRIAPKYTEAARRARVTGIVILETVVDRQGDVVQARVLKGLPMGLDQAALDAVSQWKFRPATRGGQPVDVYFILTVNFRVE